MAHFSAFGFWVFLYIFVLSSYSSSRLETLLRVF